MKAATLVDAETIEVQTRAQPDPGPTDVLVEVSHVGICGSDIHWYEHGQMGDRVVDEPLVLGHESAGHIVEVGVDVEGLAVGDAVAIEPGAPCNRCEFCHDGRYNLCPDVSFMATPGTDGAFQEYVSWPATFVHRLPPSVSTREGALSEPVSVGVQAVRRAGVDVGDTVLVTGAGPIGLLAAAVATAAGASSVAVADVVPSKLERARDRGVDVAIDSRVAEGSTAIREAFGADVDVAIEASGAPPAIETVLEVTRRGGTVVLVGLAPGERIPLNSFDLIRRELDVRGSYRFANTYPAALSLLANHGVGATELIDFEHPLDQLADALEQALEPDVVKGMIEMD